MFLLYRGLAYSAGHLIAAAAYQFLRYRGSEQNECPLSNGKLAVFLPYRLVQMLTVRRCAARTDFLPYRIEGIPAQTDVLLSGSALLPCSEPAQRYCAAASFLYAQTASDLFLRDRSAERYCAADFGLPFFLPYRAKQSHRDFAPTRCCAGWIPTGNVRPVPAAYSTEMPAARIHLAKFTQLQSVSV